MGGFDLHLKIIEKQNSFSLIFNRLGRYEMKRKKQIDFLGIGAQKCGTTWLYYNLTRIQEFSLSPIKEIHYFDRSPEYPSPSWLSETLLVNRIKKPKYFLNAIKRIYSSRKQSWKLSKFYIKWFFSNYSDNWYLSLFKDFEGFTGEITPSYSILNKEDIKKIHRLLPDVKIVLMLRNPIDRAWSHYRHTTTKMKDFNFEEVHYDEVIKFMETKDQSLRSDYISAINNYINVFREEQILICFYDAISDDPKMLLNDILNHICGNIPISISHLSLEKKINVSRTIECPKQIEEYLKDRYYDQIKELSEKYGGYFTKWYKESYTEECVDKDTILLPTMYIKRSIRDASAEGVPI